MKLDPNDVTTWPALGAACIPEDGWYLVHASDGTAQADALPLEIKGNSIMFPLARATLGVPVRVVFHWRYWPVAITAERLKVARPQAPAPSAPKDSA